MILQFWLHLVVAVTMMVVEPNTAQAIIPGDGRKEKYSEHVSTPKMLHSVRTTYLQNTSN
jgi:hypothetical protein